MRQRACKIWIQGVAITDEIIIICVSKLWIGARTAFNVYVYRLLPAEQVFNDHSTSEVIANVYRFL